MESPLDTRGLFCFHARMRSFQDVSEKLIVAAANARLNAYAPYSKYMVGAAIMARDGRIFTGCNVETANYDGQHAEENAVGAMVMAGCRSPQYVVCVGSLEDDVRMSMGTPCGKCLQVLYEFESLSGRLLTVIIEKDGKTRAAKMRECLPGGFGPASIGIDVKKYRR